MHILPVRAEWPLFYFIFILFYFVFIYFYLFYFYLFFITSAQAEEVFELYKRVVADMGNEALDLNPKHTPHDIERGYQQVQTLSPKP